MTGDNPEGSSGEVDIYRDTPVRFLGYANEVGEAFRALVHVRLDSLYREALLQVALVSLSVVRFLPSFHPSTGWVRLSYVVASGYVLADTQDKASKKLKSGGDNKEVAISAMDTLVWQAFASVIVPGFFINRLCAASLFGLARALPKVAEAKRKWAVTGIGLGSIPFIIHPIDNMVHMVMDNTTRKWIGK